MTFKNERMAYYSPRAFTIHANKPQDLKDYWTKVHFFIDGVNTTIRVAIRPPVVE